MKHYLECNNDDSKESKLPNQHRFKKPKLSVMPYDGEYSWKDTSINQEQKKQAELEKNRIIVELFPWFESVLPVK